MKLPVVHDRFSFQDLTEKYHMKATSHTCAGRNCCRVTDYSITVTVDTVCVRAKWPMPSPGWSLFGFPRGKKRLRIFLLPSGWDVIPSQGYPQR